MATHLREKESDIEIAISDENDKPRLPVFSLMGNWKILKYSATSYLDLVHETASRVEIKESDFILAMDWLIFLCGAVTDIACKLIAWSR